DRYQAFQFLAEQSLPDPPLQKSQPVTDHRGLQPLKLIRQQLRHLECLLGLAGQFVCAVAVASREMKWNEPADARLLGDMAGLASRQMPSFGGDIGVYVKERCLDEKLVGIPR